MREPNVSELEQAIIRNCSPTLAGLKPASLFTFPGSFIEDGDAKAPNRAIENRSHLRRAADACARQLATAGIRLRILVWRACGALVYVYRPEMLSGHLADPCAAEPLRAEGYPVGNLEPCIAMLAARIAEAGKRAVTENGEIGRSTEEPRPCPCSEGACRREFPHELGYFLGYPYADVAEFIRQHGENYLEFGMWKIYTERERALETFARYKRCTRSMIRAYRRRGRLEGLAVRVR